jgi:hypothetical protein
MPPLVTSRRKLLAAAALGLGVCLAAPAGRSGLSAQPPGKGPPAGKGMKDEAFAADRDVFHFLLEHWADVRRTVTNRENGVETLTESDKPEVAAKIREHVEAMHARLKEGRPIHRRDPLFDALFRHAGKITMTVEKTRNGVKVRETSEDPYTVKLIRAHAAVVSRFVAKGHAEVRNNHPVPPRDDK